MIYHPSPVAIPTENVHASLGGRPIANLSTNLFPGVGNMRQLWILGAFCLIGCQNVIGPLEYRKPVRVDDPRLPIEEQQKLGRDRLSLPDNSPAVGPPSGQPVPDGSLLLR
jgi:hypothetical protein